MGESGLSASTREASPAWCGEGFWLLLQGACGKGIVPNVDTVESSRNEIVTGAKHGVGFRWNPCA